MPGYSRGTTSRLYSRVLGTWDEGGWSRDEAKLSHAPWWHNEQLELEHWLEQQHCGARQMDGGLEERETKRLLKVCSRRVIDQLHADLETATANPEAAQKIIAKASEADLSLLRGLYTRSIGVTLSVAGVAFFGVLPRRTRPVVSAAVAVGAGSVAGVVYGGGAYTTLRLKDYLRSQPVCTRPQPVCIRLQGS